MIYRGFGFGGLVIPVVMFFSLCFGLVWLINDNGVVSVVVEKDYFDELQETEVELESCELSKVPECTPVNCGSSWTDILYACWFFICGIVIGNQIKEFWKKKPEEKKNKTKGTKK